MGHLGEHDRVLVCETIVDLIEAISPRLIRRGPGPRSYIVIVAVRQFATARPPSGAEI